MKYQGTLLSVVLALCGVAIVMTGSRISLGNNQLPPPKLDVESEPGAVLYWEFLHSGWGPRDATVLAVRTIDRILGHPVEPFEPSEPTAEGATLLSPDSEPLSIFYWAFLNSGHSPEVSTNYARRLKRRVLGIEPEDPELDLIAGTVCQVYPVNIVYCENGQRKNHHGWVNAPCAETTIFVCVDAWPECPSGETPWHTIDLACEDFPCSWVNLESLTTVPCTFETVDCECFEEVDCEELDPPQCCDHEHACAEPGDPCPECEQGVWTS